MKSHDKYIALPDSFDAREKLGTMCPSTKEIRDQGSCGSCWVSDYSWLVVEQFRLGFSVILSVRMGKDVEGHILQQTNIIWHITLTYIGLTLHAERWFDVFKNSRNTFYAK